MAQEKVHIQATFSIILSFLLVKKGNPRKYTLLMQSVKSHELLKF